MDLATTPIRLTSPAKVCTTRRKIRRIAEPLVGADKARDVELMACEAISNALVHGTGAATVQVTCTTSGIRVEVQDEGPGFEVARRVDHGRGLTIIAALASRYDYNFGALGGRTFLMFEVDRDQ